jgi:hypothetical protein
MLANEPAAPDAEDNPPAEPPRPHLLVWQEKLNASPGYRALALMSYVRRIGYVFQRNFAEYRGLVARLQDPGFALPIIAGGPETHDSLLDEAERLLHNVLMALSTRIDQQRTFISRHFADDPALVAEYTAGVQARFGGYAPGAFIRDLRNYLTHHRLPVARSQQHFSTTSFAVTFVLSPVPLREWKKWTAAARSWLDAQTGDIQIVDLLDGYARLAGEFDKWLHDRIAAKFGEEIHAYRAEAAAFDREVSRVFGGPSA